MIVGGFFMLPAAFVTIEFPNGQGFFRYRSPVYLSKVQNSYAF